MAGRRMCGSAAFSTHKGKRCLRLASSRIQYYGNENAEEKT
jgi:hypothetical protein